jgi:hypothetical protein
MKAKMVATAGADVAKAMFSGTSENQPPNSRSLAKPKA